MSMNIIFARQFYIGNLKRFDMMSAPNCEIAMAYEHTVHMELAV